MIPDSIILGINFLAIFITTVLAYKKVISHALGYKIFITILLGVQVLNGVFLEPFREKAEYGSWPHPTAYIIYAVGLLISFISLKICYKAIDYREHRDALKKEN